MKELINSPKQKVGLAEAEAMSLIKTKARKIHRLLAMLLVGLSLVAAGTLLSHTTAHALPNFDDPLDSPTSDETIECLSDVQVRSFTATPATIEFGENAMLNWDVDLPSGCTGLQLYVAGQAVGPQGSLTVQPFRTTTYSLSARLPFNNLSVVIATTTITVLWPQEVTEVTIDCSSAACKQLLLAALNTPDRTGRTDRTIYIENHVELDLSNKEDIPVAEGVKLIGGRDARHVGPLLYTNTRPKRLFYIQGDNVRITGLRIQGPELGIGCLLYTSPSPRD